MKKIDPLYILLVLVLMFSGCHRERNKADSKRLNNLDSLQNIQVQPIADSLKAINPKQLSSYNRACYQLLDVIAKDKACYTFTSDSLINSTVKTLSHYKREFPRNYARALMYQGLVRYRMGITDSTAFIPIKEAISFFNTDDKQSMSNKCLCYYYLGEIHYACGSLNISSGYYLQSLEIAKKLDNNTNLLWQQSFILEQYQTKTICKSQRISGCIK